MGLLDQINEALEEAERKERQRQADAKLASKPTYGMGQKGYSKPRRSRPIRKKTVPKKSSWAKKKEDSTVASITGQPVVWPPIKWDDVGLGMIRTIGFVPNRPVKFEFKKGMWELTGARANSFLTYFLAAGGFGLVYFLQDILNNIENWGTLLSSGIVFVPMIFQLFIRNSTMKFMPYEIEMLAYDATNSILVLSTLTQPGGAVALRLDLPQDKTLRAAEEKRILTNLKKAHAGITSIDGLATPDSNRMRTNLVWWFVFLILFGIAGYLDR